jgi:cell wall integrity and stress response component
MTPYVSVSVFTEGGTTREKTITVTPTFVPASSSGAEITQSHTGLNTGQAVGVAVGVLAFFVILGAVGVFLWLRRRKQAEPTDIPSHQNSLRGSSAGMMGTPRTEMASVWDGDAGSAGKRNSRLMPHDPRMDPAGNIYINRYGDRSHESVNTLQDNQDYSRRVLRTTNPDPTA